MADGGTDGAMNDGDGGAVVYSCTPAGTFGQADQDNDGAPFRVRESVEQLAVTHATAGEKLGLYDKTGAQVQMGTADSLGSLMFRKVAPGDGYEVRDLDDATKKSRPLHVWTIEESKPVEDCYQMQKLQPGFGYITTRDGTKLSVYVSLPGPVEDGPYPTVVNYSGYDPSRPAAPYEPYCSALGSTFPALCNPPSDPSGLIASFMGYATVSVNMRGTGCSGGAYDYFETMQLLDGYDVIETVAAQDWVKFHKVGMTGLSYPGISQLFVAKVAPPSLAAITPLSVIGNTATTLMPGGIFNDGFALSWITHVLGEADPYGQGWEQAQVDAGDDICKENQLLHEQKVDNVAQAEMTPYYDPALHDQYNPSLFVDQIKVPVFLAGAWQDEQTGPYFTPLMTRFTSAPNTRFMVYNGIHRDGFQPAVMAEWKAFLDIYVAHEVPHIDKGVRDLAPVLFNEIFKTGPHFPMDRWAGVMTWEDAKAKWESEPKLEVLFDDGVGDTKNLGSPIPAFERDFASWPPPETQALRYYLQPDGTLGDAAPANTDTDTASTFQLDPDQGTHGNLAPHGDIDDPMPDYDWEQPQEGKAVVFETAAFNEDRMLLGTASADLWVRSSADDADVQVTLSEVRPDGKETYVQSGVLRASFRKLDEAASTELWPVETFLEADISPLVPDEWTFARLPIPGFGHVFRKDSRLRVIIDTPGGTRPAWRFRLKTFDGPVAIDIGHSKDLPSSIALPLIPDGAAPTTAPLPPCPSLRGQACRDVAAYTNTPAADPIP